MTKNVLTLGPEVITIIVGAVVLLLFVATVAWPHRPKTLPGSSGHREEEGVYEEIRPDGYIDSFNKTVEEAGGAVPLLLKLALPGIIIWWVIYLIVNWTPR